MAGFLDNALQIADIRPSVAIDVRRVRIAGPRKQRGDARLHIEHVYLLIAVEVRRRAAQHYTPRARRQYGGAGHDQRD